MNFGRRPAEEAGLNLTPLIDVVFLLLIFFMVSTTFDRSGEIPLQLPSAERETPVTEQAWIDILVDARGRWFIDGQEVPEQRAVALHHALARRLEARPGDPVLLRADAQASHQSVVTVLDLLGRLGVESVSIATTGRARDGD
jgi:biopolymer transport protein ExbD